MLPVNFINLGLHQRRLLGNARQRQCFANAHLIRCKKLSQHPPHRINGFGGNKVAEK